MSTINVKKDEFFSINKNMENRLDLKLSDNYSHLKQKRE